MENAGECSVEKSPIDGRERQQDMDIVHELQWKWLAWIEMILKNQPVMQNAISYLLLREQWPLIKCDEENNSFRTQKWVSISTSFQSPSILDATLFPFQELSLLSLMGLASHSAILHFLNKSDNIVPSIENTHFITGNNIYIYIITSNKMCVFDWWNNVVRFV